MPLPPSQYNETMNDVHGLIRARLAVVRRQLDAVVDRFSDEEFHWTPREGMKTVGEQLLEIADKDRESVIWIQTGVWPDDDPPSFDLETATMADARRALREIRETTLAYLDSLSEAELELPVQSPDRWLEALGLTECPRSEVLRNIAAHEWYHTGQLVSYRLLLGDAW